MELSGQILRHAATDVVLEADRPRTISQIQTALGHRGFGVAPPARKRLADALRRATAIGRLTHPARGVYGPGDVRHGTRRRWRVRLYWLARFAERHPSASMLDGVRWARTNGHWH